MVTPHAVPHTDDVMEAEDILIVRCSHLPRAEKDSFVRQTVRTLVPVSERHKCADRHRRNGDQKRLLRRRPRMCARQHLTRHKISDRWRERAWLRMKWGSRRKWDSG